jgi:Skp family chaperone for outer membrane proteins
MKHLWLCCLLLTACGGLWGVEISLGRGGASGGTSVGFVDMERVFRDYPETRKAREDYQKEVLRHKTELAERERALAELERSVEALNVAPVPSLSPVESSTLTVAVTETPNDATAVLMSTAPLPFSKPLAPVESVGPPEAAILSPTLPPAASPSKDGAQQQEQLTKRKGELETARASLAKTLRAFEAERSKKILGRLYKELVQLAEEKGIRLVVDKSAILYGEDTVDLTEALHRRVRGLPEEEN